MGKRSERRLKRERRERLEREKQPEIVTVTVTIPVPDEYLPLSRRMDGMEHITGKRLAIA